MTSCYGDYEFKRLPVGFYSASTTAKVPLIGGSVVARCFPRLRYGGAATDWWPAACVMKAGVEVCSLRLLCCIVQVKDEDDDDATSCRLPGYT